MTVQPGLVRYGENACWPPLVRAAVQGARGVGFDKACVPEVGALLRVLASRAARIGETGTACGVGTAWLASGIGDGANVVTIESDVTLAAVAADVFANEPSVRVLAGDAATIGDYAPFDLFFTDGGLDKSDPLPILDLVAPRGLVVLDDLTPEHAWTDALRGKYGEWRNDPVRVAWRETGAPMTEIMVTPHESVLLVIKP